MLSALPPPCPLSAAAALELSPKMVDSNSLGSFIVLSLLAMTFSKCCSWLFKRWLLLLFLQELIWFSNSMYCSTETPACCTWSRRCSSSCFFVFFWSIFFFFFLRFFAIENELSSSKFNGMMVSFGTGPQGVGDEITL